jgi:putative hydrolase of the HAD superfamily
MNNVIDSEFSVAFDLDDTIFYEKDYVISGFNQIDKHIENNFGYKNSFYKLCRYFENRVSNPIRSICKELSIDIEDELVKIMRESSPKIKTRPGIKSLMKQLKLIGFEMGIITNGRSETQRLKIKALGIEEFIDILLISDEIGLKKPNLDVFKKYKSQSKKNKFLFIGNNPTLDIYPANAAGWKTIYCVSNNYMLNKFNNPDADLYVTNFFPKTIEEIISLTQTNKLKVC